MLNARKKIFKAVHNNILLNTLIILSFLIISILSFWILIRAKFFMGFYDDSFHLKRILELKESFIHGTFLPKYSFNQFHGSEIMTFYPYINLMPIALIAIFIPSKIILLDIWLVLNTFLSLVASYYSCYSYSRLKRVSYVFSVIYTTSVYLICGGQGFNGFGVATSCISLPLILFGSLRLLKVGQYVELSLGFTLMAYSHVLNSVSAGIFVLILFILNLKDFNIKTIINGVKCGILTLCLTGIVWIPMLLAKVTNRVPLALPHQPKVLKGYLLQNIFQNSISINYFNAELSIFAVMGIILAIGFYKYLSYRLKSLVLVSLIFIFMCSADFPWNYMPKIVINLFTHFQYVSRLFIIPQVILSYVFAVIVIKYMKIYIKGVNQVNVTTLIIIVLAILFQFNGQQDMKYKWLKSPTVNKSYCIHHPNIRQMEPYKITNQRDFKYLLNSTTSEYDNYFPKNSMSQIRYINRNLATYSHNNHLLIKRSGYNTFRFKNKSAIKELALPFVGYCNNDVKVKLNNRFVNSRLNRYGEITIAHIPKGINKFQISDKVNQKFAIIKLILIWIGLIWLMGAFCRKWYYILRNYL